MAQNGLSQECVATKFQRTLAVGNLEFPLFTSTFPCSTDSLRTTDLDFI